MLQRNVPAGLWLALLLIVLPFLALIGLQTYQGMSRLPRLTRDRESVAHAFQVIATAQMLKASLQDAERGQSAYVLAGEPTDLESYRSASVAIPALMDRLRQTASVSAAQQRRMATLAQQIEAGRRAMQHDLDAYQHEGRTAAQIILRRNVRLDAMHDVEATIDAIVAGENQLLTQRLARAAQDERGTAQVAVAGGILAVGLMVLGVALTLFSFHKARHQEAERRAAEQRLNAELAQSQAAFAQSQKVEALGQLTGGIAHDFNNLLHVIRNAVEIAQRRVGAADAEARRYLEMAKRNADRAASTTARLLAFARRQPLDPKPLDVNKLVSTMTDLLRHTLGENVAIHCALGSELWITSADGNQLETAILNLVVNARDAMSGVGQLTIETANVTLDEAYSALHPYARPGQYVVISVSDSGVGMTKEVMARAFEPFFTTKASGEGTGLGLSQVFGFIKQSGGHVHIYSESGAGTSVKLYLPRVARAVEPVQQAGTVVRYRSRGETILLVEDNDDVRSFTAEVLGDLGYHVLIAPDAQVALSLLEKPSEIDLLFTDVGLPNGMTGRQLAEQVLSRWPQVKVLFTTGYARNAIVHQGRLDAGVELIVKPFTRANLARKVRGVLDAAGGTLQ